MRVAFISESPEVWGAERSLLEVARRAPDCGHEATIVTDRRSPLIAAAGRCGVSVHTVRMARHPAQSDGLRKAGLVSVLRELVVVMASTVMWTVRLRRYDAVVSFSLWRNLEVALAGRLCGIPVVLDVHDTFRGDRGRQVMNVASRLARGVVGPTAYSLRAAGVIGVRQAVIPRATEVAPSDPRGRPSTPLVAGIFGQLAPHKGHELFLSAVERLVADGVHVRALLVGAPGEPTPEQVAVLRRADTIVGVEIHDKVQRVENLMAQCHVVVNLSEHEAFGRTMVEALRCGSWPIAVAGTGPAEVLERAGAGTIVDRPQAEEVAAAMAAAYTAFRTRRELGPALQELAEQRFAPTALHREYYDFVSGAGSVRTTRRPASVDDSFRGSRGASA